MHRRASNHCRAFTLTELLIAIAVIVILISILVPMVSLVQGRAKEASSKALVSQIQGAIEQYYQNFHAYPGPISNDQIWTSAFGALAPPNLTDASGNQLPRREKITGSENLVLGLMGGLILKTSGANTFVAFDPNQIGKGPMGLNPQQPQTYSPFLSGAPLSAGHFSDGAGDADDSQVPEIVDRFNNPMPILYLRAEVGASPTGANPGDNAVITWGLGNRTSRLGTYTLEQIIAYTGAFSGTYNPQNSAGLTLANTPAAGRPPANARSIGEGKSLREVSDDGRGTMVSWRNAAGFHGLRTITVGPPPASIKLNDAPSRPYYYPYDALPYFRNENVGTITTPSTWAPKQKDSYILISAGRDRVYGTEDDITSFGAP